jgi:hypothetical protein
MPFSLKRRSNAFAGETAGDKTVDGEPKSKSKSKSKSKPKPKSKRKSLLELLKGERWRKKKKSKGEEVSYARFKGYDHVCRARANVLA